MIPRGPNSFTAAPTVRSTSSQTLTSPVKAAARPPAAQCRHMTRRSYSRSLGQTLRLDGWDISAFGEEAMWMRSCAVCKALMIKLRLRDSVRCRCGWEWSGRGDPNWRIAVDQDAGILQDEGEAVMARVIEFYIPTNFRR